MKSLIVLVVGLLSVGCGKSKSLTEEEKLVGSYETESKAKHVFLKNGKYESWAFGKKRYEGTWKIVGKEVHTKQGDEEGTGVFKIESNGDLTFIGVIIDGKRRDFLSNDMVQIPLIKLKE